jgi:hypothetical protein
MQTSERESRKNEIPSSKEVESDSPRFLGGLRNALMRKFSPAYARSAPEASFGGGVRHTRFRIRRRAGFISESQEAKEFETVCLCISVILEVVS